jgi:hypothetical protein
MSSGGGGGGGGSCACCGDVDAEMMECELCEAKMCTSCYFLVRGDVLLCTHCAELLGPCSECTGPTLPPMVVDEDGAMKLDPGAADVERRCPECEELFCGDCAEGGGHDGATPSAAKGLRLTPSAAKRSSHHTSRLCPHCGVRLVGFAPPS